MKSDSILYLPSNFKFETMPGAAVLPATVASIPCRFRDVRLLNKTYEVVDIQPLYCSVNRDAVVGNNTEIRRLRS